MIQSSRQISLAILASAVLVLLLFLAGGISVFRVMEDARQQRQALDRSHRVVMTLLEVRTAFYEATAGRNQVLYHVPGPHRRTMAAANALIDERLLLLNTLLQDDPEQAGMARRFADFAATMANRLEATLRLENASNGLDLPMLLRETDTERRRLLNMASGLLAHQRQMQSGLNDAYSRQVTMVRGGFAVLFSVAALCAAAALWSLYRSLRASTGRYTALEQAKRQADAANAALVESRGRLQSILDHARDPILLVDPEERVQIANAAAAEQFGGPLHEIVGGPVRALVPGYGARSGEVQARRLDGSTFPAELSVGHYEEAGETGAVCVLRDVTERHRLDRLKSEFVSTVSHELRTPLTSIRASLGLVVGGVAGELPEEVRELLEIAHKNSERLVLLVNDILDIEKIESGRLEFRRERVSARRLLEQAVESNRAYGAQFRVSFAMTGDAAADADVYADVPRIQQVLANLLSNAAKFSPEGGVVEVSLAVDPGNVTFRVRDHGKGIPDVFRGRIFQRFAQADSSDVRQKGGTGLGLSISRAIIEHHAGTIGFTDAEGGGTCFFFTLPRLVDRAALAASLPDGQRRRALIVEDDADVAHLLRMILDQQGWDSSIAHNSAEAFACLDREQFDAMTLDLMLPEEDGLSLFRRLRQRPDGKELPVVVISAIADQGRRVLNGDAVGVVDWLDKPIDQSRLREALRQALHGADGTARILHVEDDEDIRRVVSAVMGDEAEMVPARSLAEARAQLAGGARFALVIIDVGLPDGSGLDLLDDIRGLDRPPPVLIFSASDADARTARSVAAALVKSRTENRELHDTIRHLIEAFPGPARTMDETGETQR